VRCVCVCVCVCEVCVHHEYLFLTTHASVMSLSLVSQCCYFEWILGDR